MTKLAVSKTIFKELVLALFKFVVPVIALMIMGGFLVSNLRTVADSTYNYRQQIVDTNSKISALPVLSRQLDGVTPYLDYLKSILPTKDSILSYPPSLNALARNTGLLQTITFSNEVAPQPGKLGSIQATFQETGSFKALTSYIGFLRQKFYAISFDKISINNNQGPDIRNSDSNQTLIQGTVYVQ